MKINEKVLSFLFLNYFLTFFSASMILFMLMNYKTTLKTSSENCFSMGVNSFFWTKISEMIKQGCEIFLFDLRKFSILMLIVKHSIIRESRTAYFRQFFDKIETDRFKASCIRIRHLSWLIYMWKLRYTRESL